MQVRDISGTAFSAQSRRTLRRSGEVSSATGFTTETQSTQRWRREFPDQFIAGLRRRWLRERRRRKVGRAYDMALEIARVLPPSLRIIDVGCGNGFVAHHLSAMLGTSVAGLDVGNNPDAGIDYQRYNGSDFPLANKSVDAVLLCYVLHHAQDVTAVLSETRRVLRQDGVALIYEDIPGPWWDRGMCWFHNRKWQGRTGPCTFRDAGEWTALFNGFGFEIALARRLSRWRNLMHPIRRGLFLLRLTNRPEASGAGHQRTMTNTRPNVREVRRWTRTNQADSSSSEVEYAVADRPFAERPTP
jgi:SAM-dependent methyltransferase